MVISPLTFYSFDLGIIEVNGGSINTFQSIHPVFGYRHCKLINIFLLFNIFVRCSDISAACAMFINGTSHEL